MCELSCFWDLRQKLCLPLRWPGCLSSLCVAFCVWPWVSRQPRFVAALRGRVPFLLSRDSGPLACLCCCRCRAQADITVPDLFLRLFLPTWWSCAYSSRCHWCVCFLWVSQACLCVLGTPDRCPVCSLNSSHKARVSLCFYEALCSFWEVELTRERGFLFGEECGNASVVFLESESFPGPSVMLTFITTLSLL